MLTCKNKDKKYTYKRPWGFNIVKRIISTSMDKRNHFTILLPIL